MSAKALEQFMTSVRAGLADLPSEPARKAFDYYQEFVSEALEAGRSEEEILKRLGRVEEIVARDEMARSSRCSNSASGRSRARNS